MDKPQHPDSWSQRTQQLCGEDFLEKMGKSRIAVFGVGGVGSWAGEMLVRSGLGHIILIDSDEIGESNLNRQLPALHSTLGRRKTTVLAERFRDINPGIDVAEVNEYVTPENIEAMLETVAPTFVIDAIDTLAPKLSLINACVKGGIPLVSSMGSGAKYDMTQIRITDISKTFNCPLAYLVRKRLRREYGISKGFRAVFSEELPVRESILPEETTNHKSSVGSLAYLPAAFGCACAQAAIEFVKDNA